MRQFGRPGNSLIKIKKSNQYKQERGKHDIELGKQIKRDQITKYKD